MITTATTAFTSVPAHPPARLWPNQHDAVTAACDHFASGDARCTVVAACGTGKTRVGIEAAGRVAAAGRVLVVVPTLELLRQTGQAYRAAGFAIRAVCKGGFVEWPDDAVSTDPGVIAEWGCHDGGLAVITTYQSLPVIAAAHRAGAAEWDLIVVDEAHRSAGATGRRWGVVNDDDQIPARRRLYMTATPRVFTDDDAISMDDESVFGPVVYRLTFAHAIELDLLAPYQVMVPVITDHEIKEFLAATSLARIGSVDLPREMVTAQIALARAINHHGLSKVITFHNRLDAAKRFAATWHHVGGAVGDRAANASVKAVTGRMRSEVRQQRLHHLATADPNRPHIITNARVLSEGVDVPELDAVMFADPRDSATDVMQAVGRALRKGSRADKTAVIIIPLLVNDLENPEAAIEGSKFATAWRTIQALASHDERLAHWIDHERVIKLGTYDGSKPESLPDWLTVAGTDIPPGLINAIRLRAIRSTTTAWNYGYQHLEAFMAAHGHLNVPVRYRDPDDDYPTGEWAVRQRTAARRDLPVERREQLNAIGFTWSVQEAQWEEGLQHLQAFVAAHGNLNVPVPYCDPEDDYPTGSWAATQRKSYRRGDLPVERRQRLDNLGFVWDQGVDVDANWEEGFRHVEAFMAAHGHLNVPARYCDPDDDYPTGNWVSRQRTAARRDLPVERRQRLDAIGFTWSVQEARWEEGLQHLQAFVAARGYTDVPTEYRDPDDDYPTGEWVVRQRTAARRDLPDERRQRLDAIGFTWKRKRVWKDKWEEGFRHLEAFMAAHGHSNVPVRYRDPDDDYPTGKWAVRQRTAARRDLPVEHRQRLDNLGFTLNAAAARWDIKWEEGFRHLEAFMAAHGHPNVPNSYCDPDDDYPTGNWVSRQRTAARSGDLPDQRREQLNAIGFTWDVRAAEWEAGFQHLEKFVAAHGHANPSARYRDPDDDYPTGNWVEGQRRNRETLPAKRRQRLDALVDWA